MQSASAGNGVHTPPHLVPKKLQQACPRSPFLAPSQADTGGFGSGIERVQGPILSRSQPQVSHSVHPLAFRARIDWRCLQELWRALLAIQYAEPLQRASRAFCKKFLGLVALTPLLGH